MFDEMGVKEREQEETPAYEGFQNEPGRDYRPPRPAQRGYRSLFWPMILVTVGILWLLGNLGVIGQENLSVLARIWPLVLVAVGLDILVGRNSPVLGGLIGLGVIGVVIVLIVVGPSMGLATDARFPIIPFFHGSAEIQHDVFTEPLDGAQDAEVDLDLAFIETTVSALSSGSALLVEADVDYVGNFYVNSGGGASRTVELGQRGSFNLNALQTEGMHWNIGLTPDIPLDLEISGGAAHAELNLEELNLRSLTLDGGAGRLDVYLPAMPEAYLVEVDAGAATTVMTVPDNSDVILDVVGSAGRFEFSTGSGSTVEMVVDAGAGTVLLSLGDRSDLVLEIDGGAGRVEVTIPQNTGVRITIEEASAGRVDLPADFEMVDDGGDNDDDTGTWESPNYGRADHSTEITVSDLGAGSITIQH